MRRSVCIGWALLLILGLTGSPACGMSGTSQIAQKGQPVETDVADDLGWPSGVLDMINVRTRTNGWQPWFSEWPNDVNHYEFHFRNTGELNGIIRKLARIDSKTRVIMLSPETEPRAIGFTTVLPEGNGASGLFSIGSQKLLDQWFERLPDGQFGVHHLTEPPKAMPPTLTIYTANPAIDLSKLQVSAKIDVDMERSEPASDQPAQDEALREAITVFVKEHKAKQEAEAKEAAIDCLLKTKDFYGNAVGDLGVEPEEVKAFRLLLNQPEPAGAFKHIVKKGGTVGRLYALCGLYLTDQTSYAKYVDRFKLSQTKIKAQFGCLVIPMSAADIVYNDDPNTIRLEPGETVAEWRARHPDVDAKYDIAGGGYPRLLEGASE